MTTWSCSSINTRYFLELVDEYEINAAGPCVKFSFPVCHPRRRPYQTHRSACPAEPLPSPWATPRRATHGYQWYPVLHCNTAFLQVLHILWQVLHILQYVQYWLLASIAHTMQYCNTDACGRDALCRHYVMSLFDRYMLQPATTCTEEALWAQYMNVLLMGMSFSGLSTLFTSVRAIPKSGPVQVSAILWILVCAILPFLQVLHIPWYVQ